MSKFDVTIGVTAQVTYNGIEADNLEQAKQLALAMTSHTMRFADADVVEKTVYDCRESEER